MPAPALQETVKVFDAVTGDEHTALTGHTDWMNAVAWSPDGTRLAAASDDETMKVFDAVTGYTIETVILPDPYCVAWPRSAGFAVGTSRPVVAFTTAR